MATPVPKKHGQLPPTKVKLHFSEQEILTALRKRYPGPEWVLFPQVRNGTGYSRQVRTADAIAMNLWPSRGLDLLGFEFKSYRSDWLRELKDPAKSEEIQRFCDYWWVVVSNPEVVKADDPIPPTWGVLVINKGKIKVFRDAPRLKAEVPTKLFIASVMRAASEFVTPEAWIKAAEAEAYQRGITEGEKRQQWEIKSLRDSVQQSQKSIDDFQKASGVHINKWDAGHVGNAVRIVSQGPQQVLSYLKRERQHLVTLAASMDDAIKELGGEE